MAFQPRSVPILLDQYNVRTLRLLAERLGLLRAEPAPRAALIEHLSQFLGGPEHVQMAERTLGQRHWQALAMPRLASGEAVSLQALRIRLQMLGTSREESLQTLQDLLATGCLVYASGDRYSNAKLELPTWRDMEHKMWRSAVTFPRLAEIASRHKGSGPAALPSTSPPFEVREGSIDELQREVFLALRLMADGAMRLTSRGLPYKADVARLAAQSGARQLGESRRRAWTAPPRLWFVLSLLESAGLVDSSGPRMNSSEAAEEFLRASTSEQAGRLWEAWFASRFDEFRQIPTLSLDYYAHGDELWADDSYGAGGDIPDLGKLQSARTAVATTITQLLPVSWTTPAELAQAVRAWDPEFLISATPTDPYAGRYGYYYGNSFSGPREHSHYQKITRRGETRQRALLRWDEDWMEVEGAYVAQVVAEPLFWLGMVDLGYDREGNLCAFRLSRLARHLWQKVPLEVDAAAGSGPPLVVQPNFEVMVLEATANLGLLARLDDFAERRSLDRAAVYRLTRDSVVRGLDRGLSGPDLITLLEDASRAALPQNVRYTLEEWVRLYESVHLRRRATLLEADSPEEMEDWLSDPGLGALLGRRLSPTTVLVPATRRGQVENALRSYGRKPPVVDYSRPARGVFQVNEVAQVLVRRGHDEPHLRYRLGRLADLVQETEDGPIYQITPASVGRALQSGLDGHLLVSYLQARAAGPLPADAILKLRGWAGLYPPLRYQPAMVLEAPPLFRWEDLAAVPAIRNRLLGMIDGRLALVRPEDFEDLHQVLAERGIRLENGLSEALKPRWQSAPVNETIGEETTRRHLLPESESVFDLVARAVTEAPSLSPDQRVVVNLEQSMLVRFLEQARREGRWIYMGWTDAQGEEIGAAIRPTSLWRRGRDYFVNVLAKGGKTITLPLQAILGVAPEPSQ